MPRFGAARAQIIDAQASVDVAAASIEKVTADIADSVCGPRAMAGYSTGLLNRVRSWLPAGVY